MMFKASIIRDVVSVRLRMCVCVCVCVIRFVQGLNYIHKSAVKTHGSLNIQNCLIDDRWVVKLVGFGLLPLLKPLQLPSKNQVKPKTPEGQGQSF